MTVINENKGVKFITYEIFNKIPFLYHSSSTRVGGVSKGELGAMNFGAATRDLKENIDKNYSVFSDATGIKKESIVISSQFHNANIKVCSKKDRGEGVTRPLSYSDIDGLVTNEEEVTLCVFSADCIPVLLCDVKNKSVGACHCGWRGTYKNLPKLMIEKMGKEYGTKPENLKAVIAPGISKCCYEVSEELWRDFVNKFSLLKDTECAEIRHNKFYLNLPYINKKILENSGVLTKNIYISDLCTCCNSKFLHSHRATDGKRGIMGHFIGIKNQT